MTAISLEHRLEALGGIAELAVRAAAQATERIAREEGAKAGPVHLGKKRRRTKLTARTRIRGSGDSWSAITFGVPTGPWVWVTAGTRPHTIPKTKARGRGKQRRTRYLKAAGYPHPIGRPIMHPGAPGRGAWFRVVDRAAVEVPDVIAELVTKRVRRGS